MHNKMCKKIAQLTKNEEQEAALQALNEDHGKELRRILTETCQEEDGSALRTRLLQLQESLDEQQRVGAQVQADFEFFRMQSEERGRETEAELRRDFEERLRFAREELREAESRIDAAREENLRLGKELERAEETVRDLSDGREPAGRSLRDDEKKETRQKAEDEESESVKKLREEVNVMKEETDRREEAQRRAADEERERWERRLRDEKEEMRKEMEAEWREEQRRREQREDEEKKGMHSALKERVKKAEAEVESHLERQAERKRNALKLQERIQNLEEELEADRKRASEAEASAKRAEEELAVAKERLLLQEDELQSRAEELLNAGCKACACDDVEDLKSQLSRLQSRNRELELQNSGRNSDHARQIRQHAEALSSLRSEMVRAQTEELRRIQKHADEERDKLRRELDKERENLQKEREQEKSHSDKERNRLRRERDEEKEALRREADAIGERVRRETEEEAQRLRKELEVERVRVRAQLDKNFEQVEAQKAALRHKLDEEKRRLAEKAEEDRRRLKEQVRKAIEEVMRRHAAELHAVREALDSEKTTNREVCGHLEEERRKNGELHDRLERDRQELELKLKDADNEIFRLKTATQHQGEKDRAAAEETSAPCGAQCWRLRQDLQRAQSRLTRLQDEAEEQRTRQQSDVADRHRPEEKLLELSRLDAERNILEGGRRAADERVRAECEDALRAEFRIEMNAAVAESEQRWRQREAELHARMAKLTAQLDQLQTESKKEEAEADSRGDLEMGKLRKEVEDTKEMNTKLRELLQEPQSLAEERHNHAAQLQALERQARDDALSERNRLQTVHRLELDKQRAELTQQHTEWTRQTTQRHMQQIEDLQNQLQAHTQMMALQQDLKQQNQNQVFERQLDESRCAMLELQRENAALKKRLHDKSIQATPKLEAKEEAGPDLQKTGDVHLEDEAMRLKEEVEKLRVEMETLEESHKLWEEKKEDDDQEEEEEERRRTKELEDIRKEHKREIQNLLSEYGGAQMQLQARIVALENELREREERCRRRDPRWDRRLQLGKLQERLTEREQLIKRLVLLRRRHLCGFRHGNGYFGRVVRNEEERHQLQVHPPPVVGDDGGLRICEKKPRPGSVTPTTRRKAAEGAPGPSSSTLPHQPTSQPRASPRYSSSSLPHKHASPSPPSLPRSPRSRTSCVPPTPAPTGPLPVCPSPQTAIRYVSPASYLQARSIRGPYLEQRGAEGLKQEWFTKYFSF
ncbi:protein FAM184B isoform X2 [Syngnathoides biaculeatus]|uniref:protein FAM184B isoform X2 n=1 Tax=Syngnathoides biaculeatus TaxID=300417 RepID=UPI002ADD4735|nr:protein FAM184B isoform X2 [Syngnathoides biaculeatus]